MLNVKDLQDRQELGLRTHSPRGLKVMESMEMLAERVGEVWVETLKVAVSPGLTGAVSPNQLLPVFQSAEGGAASQVASTASKEEGRSKKEERSENLPPRRDQAGKTGIDSRMWNFGVQVNRA